MEVVFLIVGFIVGYLFKGAMAKGYLKNHRDVLNWLKSNLAQMQNKKLTKTVDKDKIELYKLIIARLTK